MASLPLSETIEQEDTESQLHDQHKGFHIRISSLLYFRGYLQRWSFNLSPNKAVDARIPRPTPEEVREWSTNFDALLSHEYGLLIFHDFLKSQHSQENLNFWIAVERYKSKPQEAIESEAKLIYENYISIMSPTEISIDSKTRNAVEMNMEHPSTETFKPAQEQIYILMKRDCLPRFLKSKQYRRELR